MNENSITFVVPMPTSTNRIWRSSRGRVFLSDEYKTFKTDVYVALLAQRVKKCPWDKVSVTVSLYPKTKQKIDVDNRFKSLFDALTAAGFWSDDSIVYMCTAFVHDYHKHKKGVADVCVSPYYPQQERKRT